MSPDAATAAALTNWRSTSRSSSTQMAKAANASSYDDRVDPRVLAWASEPRMPTGHGASGGQTGTATTQEDRTPPLTATGVGRPSTVAGVGPGVSVDADDERTCVGDNGVHAIGIPLRETVIAVAADRRRARERSLRGRTVMGHGPLGVGQASYQATDVGRLDAGRPPLSDSSLARRLRGHCCHESRQ